ncbi:MAG TPA: FecR domain-containing protein [Pyrinomonadaceae bacterium]|jgi:ferric-dicitrate binding protein FerR (iron transport regulator)|nr:FecR domain-containing protein [Pyrinomonadaceae bacterium]
MFRKSTLSRVLILAIALSLTLAVTSFAVQQPSGELAVIGTVKVNGGVVDNGFTLTSGSNTTTAKGSSAVVSLGKLGRVELLPSSGANISFDAGNIKVALESGRVRLSSGSGTAARISTKDGEAVADATQDNSFTVDTTCGDTLVTVQTGRVELRAGGTVKQIAAGGQDTAGVKKPGLCRGQRP